LETKSVALAADIKGLWGWPARGVITVDGITALIMKSANDVAVMLAEAVSARMVTT
jgi:hypothetical protein